MSSALERLQDGVGYLQEEGEKVARIEEEREGRLENMREQVERLDSEEVDGRLAQLQNHLNSLDVMAQ